MFEAQKEIAAIVDWLRDHTEKTGTRGYLLGLSGGIDSAVVAALCERALPGHTLAVIMPCYSDSKDVEDAELVAEKIGCRTIITDLTPSYDKIVGSLQGALDVESTKLALANIKPRLRMVTLYYYANLLNYLVVGTSNKCERYVGYFTKWGDGAADVLPIAHLLKSQVRQLAVELGIPQRVIDKPPSAGLWQGQTDEQEMGFSYQQLEAHLTGQPVSEDAAQRIEKLHRTSRHKLHLPPTM